MAFNIIIPGKPLSTQFRIGNGKLYNQHREEADRISNEIFLQKPPFILDKPVALDIRFCMEIPKSYKKKIHEGEFHIKKPDLTNLVKFIEDCMTGIVYKDDCCVCETSSRKVYSNNPRIEIEVRTTPW